MRGGRQAQRLILTGGDTDGDQHPEEHNRRTLVRLHGLTVRLANLAHGADTRTLFLTDLVRRTLTVLFRKERGPVRRQDMEQHGDTLPVAVIERP